MVKRYHSELAHRLGRNLSHYRKRAKFTQEQLAEAIQVEVATVSRYETGATLPSLVTLETVAALLRVSIADLLAEKAPSQPDEGEQIRVMLELLLPEERRAALEVLTTLVDFLRKQNPVRDGRVARKPAVAGKGSADKGVETFNLLNLKTTTTPIATAGDSERSGGAQ
jgi:transcriptional regulator with XRE-family HTH domain